jgi:glycosyltransferase involved in cell wall biosynthesis
MPKISVAVICYNEEDNIARCLSSVSWADEIVILDSFSTDRTLEICRRFTDKIYQHEFDGHIEQKNRVLGYCSNDWVFSIDSDEEVSPELRQSLIEWRRQENVIETGAMVNRSIYYLGQWIRYTSWYPDYKIRLFRKDVARWGGINPHDTILLKGKVARLSGHLYHYSYRDVSDHLRTIDKFTTISAREYKARGRKPSWLNLTLRPLFGIFKSYVIKRGFMQGKLGWMIAFLDGYYVLLKFMKIYELNVHEREGK